MDRSALILIGYQNDYYSTDGILHGFLEDSGAVRASLDRTLELMQRLAPTNVPFIETPIVFTPDYHELNEPMGILAAIRDTRAFQAGMVGSQQVAEFGPLGDRITEVPGKRGLNAFVGTRLEELLRSQEITHLYLCGSVASICVDSTGRYAAERGFHVTVVADCVTGRTHLEHDFYMKNVFTLYADVLNSGQVADRITQGELAGVGEAAEAHDQRTRN